MLKSSRLGRRVIILGSETRLLTIRDAPDEWNAHLECTALVKDFQPIFGNGRGRAGLLLQFHPNASNNAAVYCRELHTIVGWYISISYHFVVVVVVVELVILMCIPSHKAFWKHAQQ